MPPNPLNSTVLPRIADGTPYAAVDVFGPTVEFISGPDDSGADFSVMRGVVPPGVTVRLHSHDDAEDFFMLSGGPTSPPRTHYRIDERSGSSDQAFRAMPTAAFCSGVANGLLALSTLTGIGGSGGIASSALMLVGWWGFPSQDAVDRSR